MSDDRERWNRRYAEGWPMEPSPFLESIADLLPRSGRALDVAGGNGRNALWLADRGLSVTVVDVSDAALTIAADAARARGLTLDLINADLQRDALPVGPWDLILCFHYLQKGLFPKMIEALAPGGVLVCAIATVRNLERHPRPPREHVLDEGELPGLVEGLAVVRYEEAWFDDHHEARLVATRRP
ncbi:MAG TPA: class I SAM-dependent methyltransferase [Actinobacteria bacterium]|nr:class I SAM-dependent methyltransferase [Actinomycetota bacterium]